MNLICKYCKVKLNPLEPNAALNPNLDHFWYVCYENHWNFHEPMDNLDYIEYLAKKKHLV